jgi:hypothetical protein
MDKFTVSDNDERSGRPGDNREVKVDRQLTGSKNSLVWTMSKDEAKALRDTLNTYLNEGADRLELHENLDKAIRDRLQSSREGAYLSGWIIGLVAQLPEDAGKEGYFFYAGENQGLALSMGLAHMQVSWITEQFETGDE